MENVIEMNRVKTVKYTFTDVFCMISIVFSFLFDQYYSFIPGVTVSELLLIISCVLVFVTRRGRIFAKDTRSVLVFFIVGLVLSIIAIVTTNVNFDMESKAGVFSRWIRYFAHILFIVFLVDNFSGKGLFFSFYKYACIIISIYTILQYFIYLAFGIVLPTNFLPINTINKSSTEVFVENVSGNSYFRASGIFVEPSYLAKFLLPGVVIAFYGFEDSKKINIYTLIFVSIALILSASLQGVVILAISILLCLFFSLNNNFVKSLLIIVVLAILVLFMLYSGFFSSIVNRINKTQSGKDYSTNLRLYRGFALWGKLPFIYKIIGVGLGNAANYADTYEIYTDYDYYLRNSNTLQYMNGISGIMVEIGLIGLFFFIIVVAYTFKKVSKEGKLILIQFLLILLTGSSFFSVTALFFFFTIFLFKKERSVD